jgi:hypothetical protein
MVMSDPMRMILVTLLSTALKSCLTRLKNLLDLLRRIREMRCMHLLEGQHDNDSNTTADA